MRLVEAGPTPILTGPFLGLYIPSVPSSSLPPTPLTPWLQVRAVQLHDPGVLRPLHLHPLGHRQDRIQVRPRLSGAKGSK